MLFRPVLQCRRHGGVGFSNGIPRECGVRNVVKPAAALRRHREPLLRHQSKHGSDAFLPPAPSLIGGVVRVPKRMWKSTWPECRPFRPRGQICGTSPGPALVGLAPAQAFTSRAFSPENKTGMHATCTFMPVDDVLARAWSGYRRAEGLKCDSPGWSAAQARVRWPTNVSRPVRAGPHLGVAHTGRGKLVGGFLPGPALVGLAPAQAITSRAFSPENKTGKYLRDTYVRPVPDVATGDDRADRRAEGLKCDSSGWSAAQARVRWPTNVSRPVRAGPHLGVALTGRGKLIGDSYLGLRSSDSLQPRLSHRGPSALRTWRG